MLAEAWSSAGATSLALIAGDQVLFSWSSGDKNFEPGLEQPLKYRASSIGALRVFGVAGKALELRLRTDANLLEDLIAREIGLEETVSVLVESQDQLMALSELAKATHRQLDIQRSLEILSRQVNRLINGCGAFINFQFANLEPHLVQEPGELITVKQADLLLQHRSTILFTREQGPIPFPKNASHLSVHPLRFRGELIGNLGVFLHKPTQEISPDLKLAVVIANHIEGHLETVLLHRESIDQTRLRTELDLARDVQLKLLPTGVPKVPGLDVYAVSVPALQVGGDFYDFIPDQNRPPIFVVGDVAGKGMPAALMMATTRRVLRSTGRYMPNASSASLMARANDDLYGDFTTVGLFATLFLARFDGERLEFHYANAGHSPVIYCPATEEPKLLEADGPALGVLPIALSHDHTLSLRRGDLVVIATDGLNEAVGKGGEMFGYDRLLEVIKRNSHLSADGIARAMMQSVQDFSAGQSQADDQTLIILKGVG